MITMEEAFYRDKLSGHGLDVLTLDADERAEVHRIIYDELVTGPVTDTSRNRYIEIADRLVTAGAQAVIAGCTEIELLLRPTDLNVPLYAIPGPMSRLLGTRSSKNAVTRGVEWRRRYPLDTVIVRATARDPQRA
jgi:hypothetical protein